MFGKFNTQFCKNQGLDFENSSSESEEGVEEEVNNIISAKNLGMFPIPEVNNEVS